MPPPQAVNVTATPPKTLADRIEDLLPQTQCTKCGYPACRPYAEAIAAGEASYNQCPPGGIEGVARLARLLGKPVIPLNPENGVERPRPLAVIDESVCIGCTLCMQACPVDAIVGAAKQMHTIIPELCTGCDLCVPPCPVDCIAMIPVTGEQDRLGRVDASKKPTPRAIGMTGASRASRANAKRRKRAPPRGRRRRQPTEAGNVQASTVAPATDDADADADAKKRAIIQAALERARKKKEELAKARRGAEEHRARERRRAGADRRCRRTPPPPWPEATSACGPRKNDSDH